jgi:hypothetical protein
MAGCRSPLPDGAAHHVEDGLCTGLTAFPQVGAGKQLDKHLVPLLTAQVGSETEHVGDEPVNVIR